MAVVPLVSCQEYIVLLADLPCVARGPSGPSGPCGACGPSWRVILVILVIPEVHMDHVPFVLKK